jgi:5-methylcytosine-specific restriction endonuclease McrA
MSNLFTFSQNKYTKWYFNIIIKAKNREIFDYTENHHIIPKCLGGNNKKENLVKLTSREHFICHWLLTKMVENKKHKFQLWNAFSCMLYRNNKFQKRYKITSRKFENIKKEGSKIKSLKFSGKNNPMYGLKGNLHPAYGKKWTEEMKINGSNAHKGLVRSLESRLKQSEKTKGRKQTVEHIAKRIHKGRVVSEETKEKIRKSILNMPLHTCENCGLATSISNYKRWHGENCKKRGEVKLLV